MIAAARFVSTIVDCGTALTNTVSFLFQGPPNSSIWWWNWNWRKWRYAERWSKSASVSRQGCLPGLNHFSEVNTLFIVRVFVVAVWLFVFQSANRNSVVILGFVLSRLCDWLKKKSSHFLNQSQLKPKPIVTCSHAWHPLMYVLKDLTGWKLLRHLLD